MYICDMAISYRKIGIIKMSNFVKINQSRPISSCPRTVDKRYVAELLHSVGITEKIFLTNLSV